MDIKVEPIDEEYQNDEQRPHDEDWFEVPIQRQGFEDVPACVNYIKTEVYFEQPYIKQEISEDSCGTETAYKVPNASDVAAKEFPPQVKREDYGNIGECSQTFDEYSNLVASPKEIKSIVVPSDCSLFNAPERDSMPKCVDFTIEQRDIKQETSEIVAVVKLIKLLLYERYFVCGICYETFPLENVLQVHKMAHNGSVLKEWVNESKESKIQIVREKKFKCTECDYRCLQSTTLKRHYMVHSGEKPFKCSECKHECRSYTHLKVHQMIHSGEKPFQCPQCSFKCRTPSDMKVHGKTHSGEKPFSCDSCDYRCVASTTLKRHKMVHTGELPLKCKECDFRCRTPYHMKVHHEIHSGAKPFKCTECSYECIHATTLKIHKMIHSGDRPFDCAECQYKSRTAYRLKKHMKVHQGDKSSLS